MMDSFLFKAPLESLDHDIFKLIQAEEDRQRKRLILIPSESVAPPAVRDALGSVFQNVYAEGYPHEITRHMPLEQIMDFENRLTHYRRFADPRYYKGVEFADMLEALARQRCAQLFAANDVSANELYVNVQPLSGAPANNAVYTALLKPGDTLMGMHLLHGGHLTHGSPVNRSGKLFNIISYEVDPTTEQLDYEAIEALALQHKPKIIIAGYSSYPMIPDWQRFRAIADKVGATLLTDISHIAGLIAAGVVPSPVGHAHIITFTTHKTLCGPRGACIIVQDENLSDLIDKAVFPGEQGGPHLNTIAGMAVAFKLAATEQFKQLQQQILDNCQAMVDRLTECGLSISYGGTDSHLANINCSSITGPDGAQLNGDLAARILDVAGIVVNRNTIPGDRSALRASGIRFGSPWITQRGFKTEDAKILADLIADLLLAITPYKIQSRTGFTVRAKVAFTTLQQVRLKVRELCQKFDTYEPNATLGYPYNYTIEDSPSNIVEGWTCYEIKGEKAAEFANFTFTSDTEDLGTGKSQKTSIVTPSGEIEGVLSAVDDRHYMFSLPVDQAAYAAAWLRDLSDSYTIFDEDLQRRIPGPVIIEDSMLAPITSAQSEIHSPYKPWYIGMPDTLTETEVPAFTYQPQENETPKKTILNQWHHDVGANMVVFAGWEMPVQYSSILDEHLAVRQAAGLFDVSHMGVFQAEGPSAATFLDCVCGNDISGLDVGHSCYTHFLDPDGHIIDDLIVYRRAANKFLVVVNAANTDIDWQWLKAVKNGSVLVDKVRPSARVYGRDVILKNLHDPQHGDEMLVDIALQGAKSMEVLLCLGVSPDAEKQIRSQKRSTLLEITIKGYPLVISRTGYTGENMGYEIFIHPAQAVAFWQDLIDAGQPLGLKPCGLGARDSLRTEYGLPLYGHELDGPLGVTVGEAGFAYFVKTYKPWFIGREAFMEQEAAQKRSLVRFRFVEQRTRKAHLGDPVMNERGKVIGQVTSCAVATDGYFTGQAVIDSKFDKKDSTIYIYQGSPQNISKAPAELTTGDQVILPSPAVILSRYMVFGRSK